MTRTTVAPARSRKKARLFQKNKGYYGGRRKNYRQAKEARVRANVDAYIGRKQKKRLFRELWIIRISAACKERGGTYSKFIYGLKISNVKLNRKMISEIAIHDPQQFDMLFKLACPKQYPQLCRDDRIILQTDSTYLTNAGEGGTEDELMDLNKHRFDEDRDCVNQSVPLITIQNSNPPTSIKQTEIKVFQGCIEDTSRDHSTVTLWDDDGPQFIIKIPREDLEGHKIFNQVGTFFNFIVFDKKNTTEKEYFITPLDKVQLPQEIFMRHLKQCEYFNN